MSTADHLAPSPRVLVVTGDVLTSGMGGPAIRAWSVAHQLSKHHEVVLATTSGICTRTSDAVRLAAPARDSFGPLENWCDILIVQGFVLEHVPELRASEKYMVVDLYTPLHLETLALSQEAELPARQTQNGLILAELNRQLVRGDFFLCANERQRDLWLGFLSALGRVNPLNWDADPTFRSLIDTVPFGLDDVDPVKTERAIRGVVPGIGEHDELIVWGGGVYNWFDPITLILAIDRLKEHRPNVRLYFFGLRHPNPEVPAMAIVDEMLSLSADLGLTDRHVFFNEGWIDYKDRHNYLLEADLAVTVHPVNVETTFSFRTRVLDYLWAGLPIVTTEGDVFADLVDQEGLGLTAPPGDPCALSEVIARLLSDPSRLGQARARAVAVRDRYRWSVVLEPLAEFCRSPRRAADRGSHPQDHGRRHVGQRLSLDLVRRRLNDGGPREVGKAISGRLKREIQARIDRDSLKRTKP